nr:7526_t:CDS:10 [Entrophospora candida]
MKEYFKNWKFYLIDAKLKKEKIEFLQNLIENVGGEIVNSVNDADVILTILKSPARIIRYISPELSKLILSIDWIEEWLRAPYDNFLISLQKNERKDTQSDPDSRSSITSNSEDGDNKSDAEVLSDGEEELDSRFLNTKYACLRPTPLASQYNQSIIEFLSVLERSRELDGEHASALGYHRAIAALKAYPRDVKSYKEAMKIKGIGDRIGNLIKKYFELDTIPEAEKILDDPKFLTLDLFTRVFGVGTKKANEWYNKGYETIDDCKKDPNLTNVQKIGLEMFDDFQKKMTREDVEEIFEILNKEVKSIDSQYFLTIVGGYRRGKEFNGDLDVILSHPEEELEPFILKKIVNRLADKGLLKHKLWYSESSNARNSKYIKCGLLKRRKNIMDRLDKCFIAFWQQSTNLHRQVDIIIAPKSQYATAVLGWTGSRHFERTFKDYARKEKGIIFASHGLFTNTWPRKRIDASSEKEIFELVGIPWLEPEMRNF